MLLVLNIKKKKKKRGAKPFMHFFMFNSGISFLLNLLSCLSEHPLTGKRMPYILLADGSLLNSISYAAAEWILVFYFFVKESFHLRT